MEAVTVERSMEECAREACESLSEEVRRLVRLEALDGRADRAAEELREELEGRAYGAGVSVTVDVTLYGGGPAGGIEFECERGRYGWEWMRARQWHQDWFQPKGYVSVDDDVADRLWNLWGLEYTLEELSER